MKLDTINGQVVVRAESLSDIKRLFKLVKSEEVSEVRTYTRRVHSKRECGLCGKLCHGKKGVATHQRANHNSEFIANGKHAILA